MPVLIWDRPGTRVYESGLDKGVLYLPDGSAVAWNGLSSVIEKFDKTSTPVYFDGMKIQNLVVLGDFEATMSAVTYPDEFTEIEGQGRLRRGVFVGDQEPQVFGLCYRTMVGDDLEGPTVGYKIHVLYNVTAIPNDKTYASVSDNPSLVEFEWTISAVPEEFPGFRPTAHIEIDTRDLDPWLLEDIEEKLYGSSSAEASLIPMLDLITFLRDWYRVKIIDNGDGSWTALESRPGFISFLDGVTASEFQITEVNAVYLDDVTFVISDTTDIAQVPQIRIDRLADGAWEASTEQDNLIFVFGDGTFEIRNANVVVIDSETYNLSDTLETD